jgi:crotonobetainyl-CoA:carnitine CoA-transferase CaiB-like acyl-CoA transferase
MSNNGPLDGVLIADFTQLAQGPFATMILGDMGAEIVKIEPPGGDWMRNFALSGIYAGGETVSYLSFNRNKRSIGIDLKSKEGLELVRKLCDKADVVIENFRPGVMKRLGIDYESLKKTNPDIILVSSSGYGSSGPYVTRPGQDLLAQAITGFPTVIGRKDDPPTPIAAGIADLTAGFHIVYATLAALISRNKTGQGQSVEVNLMNSILVTQTDQFTAYLQNGIQPERSSAGIANPWTGAPYGIYKCSDGWIAIAMNPLKDIGEILGIEEFKTLDSKNEIPRRDEFKIIIEVQTQKWKVDDLLHKMLEKDLWCAPLQDYAAVIKDPQVLHNEMVVSIPHPTAGTLKTLGIPVKFNGTPSKIRKHPPLFSEHADELAKEYFGLSASEISDFYERGIISKPRAV